MRNHINDMECDTWTPLAESYLEILHYFSQAPPYYYNGDYSRNPGGLHDPYYDKNVKAMVPCRKSFVLMITDGESTMDQYVPDSDGDLPNATSLRDYDNDSNDPGSYPSNGTDYLDDISLYGHTNDLRPDPGSGWGNRELADDQSIECFVIYAFGQSGSQLLMDAAKNGGFEDRNGNKIPDLQKEWDDNGDGIPDNYYEAHNGNELEEAIMNALMEILSRISSSSGIELVTAGTKSGGVTAQSQFYPRRVFEGGEILTWIGTCQSLWVDQFGWLREDTENDAILHLQNDYVVTMEYNDNLDNVMLTRLHDVNGTGDETQFDTVETVPVEDMLPIWDGGKWLWNHSPDERTIITFIDDNKDGMVDPSEINDFIPTNASVLRPHLRMATDNKAEKLIHYIRGTDFAAWRTRTVNNQVWKLGDVINAGAVAVQGAIERYDFIYGDYTYTDYFNQCKDRRIALYVGANDGMLHCFNSGKAVQLLEDVVQPMKLEPAGYDLGKELWAYIPYNLLPHLKWLKDPGYCHVYYVDLKPYVTDAQIFTSDAVHPHGWGTILIGGMRLGGRKIKTEVDTCLSAYFALDITDPLNPVPLWEFKANDLDLTFCYTSVVKIDDSWYLVLGSGPKTCSGDQ
jgi:type IV pilus assembly protein PilY1